MLAKCGYVNNFFKKTCKSYQQGLLFKLTKLNERKKATGELACAPTLTNSAHIVHTPRYKPFSNDLICLAMF